MFHYLFIFIIRLCQIIDVDLCKFVKTVFHCNNDSSRLVLETESSVLVWRKSES